MIGFGKCADCDGTVTLTEHGTCAFCGGSSILPRIKLPKRGEPEPALINYNFETVPDVFVESLR